MAKLVSNNIIIYNKNEYVYLSNRNEKININFIIILRWNKKC